MARQGGRVRRVPDLLAIEQPAEDHRLPENGRAAAERMIDAEEHGRHADLLAGRVVLVHVVRDVALGRLIPDRPFVQVITPDRRDAVVGENVAEHLAAHDWRCTSCSGG